MSGIDRLITALLVGVLAFASIDKIFHLNGFINAINDYRISPIPLGPYVAPLIIALELAIAIGLLTPAWRRTAALQGGLLFSLFALILAVNNWLGGRGVCGCWFSITLIEGNAHLGLNFGLSALALLLWHSLRPTTKSRHRGQATVPLRGGSEQRVEEGIGS